MKPISQTEEVVFVVCLFMLILFNLLLRMAFAVLLVLKFMGNAKKD